MDDTPTRPTLHPSKIAQFCKLGQCSMYLFHEYVDDFLDSTNIDDVPVSPLYAETGKQFERSQLEEVLAADVYSIGTDDVPESVSVDETWTGDVARDMDRVREVVRDVDDGTITCPVVLYQVPLRAEIGVWPVRSEVDIVFVVPKSTGVELRVVEVKSATTAKTHHQIQAAIYAMQFDNVLASDPYVSASIVAQDAPLSSVVTSSGVDIDCLETFELGTRENDVRLLLEQDGALDDLLYDASPADPPNNRIDARCDSCSKQAKCFARGVANHGLELLGTFGLSEGVQESLREFDITSIDDITELYQFPRESWDRKPYNYDHLEPTDPDKVRRIQQETEISNLADLAQVAHRFRREIDPSFDGHWDRTADGVGPWSEYLIGSGTNLPDDDPNVDGWDEYPRKSLIRIYPYVQMDHVRDRVVLLAAKVTSTRYEEATGEDGLFFVARPEGLPDDHDAAVEEERRLLVDFFEKLAWAVSWAAPDLEGDGRHALGSGYVHLYPYSDSQRDALMDAVKRHDQLYGSEAIQTLLGFRADIDQEAVSILQEDFRQRHALRYPGLGIVQTATQFFGGNSDFSWEAPRANGPPLKTVFAEGFFEVGVSFDDVGTRIIPRFDEGYQVPDAGGKDYFKNHYPVLGRHRDGLPLEYIWGSADLDRLHPDWADDDETRDRIQRFRYRTDEESARITLDDVEDVVEAICEAYQHVERCIEGKDAFVSKAPIDIGNLDELTLGNSTLQSTVVEYQNLEFGTRCRDREDHYRKSLAERVAAGRAIPFTCDRTPDDDERQIRGSIIRDIGDGTNSGLHAETALSIETGDMVVMTPLAERADGYEEDVDKPQKYANSVLGFLSSIDPEAGRVTVSAPWRYRRRSEPNMVWHKGWTNDPDDLMDGVELVEEGTAWVLDPAVDDFAGSRARQAIRYANQNDIHNRLLDLYDHDQRSALRYSTPFCSQSQLQSFLTEFDDVMPESTNTKQEAFVTQVNHSVVVAQGPPGTGKTSYGQAPATLGRAYAFDQAGESFGGVVSAHSNTAVDEAAVAVADAHERLVAEKGILTDLRLVRVRSTGSSLTRSNSNFEDLHYYRDSDRLRDLYDETLCADEAEQIVFFTTPVTLRNLINTVASLVEPDVDQVAGADEDAVDALIRTGEARVFDFALIDEASMMDLPLLFLLGAFLRQSRQLMLIGDHRQMRPIQSHDWEAEDRQTIEEHTPSLSVLNLMRFLRGQTDDDETLEYLEREPPQWSDPDQVLPLVQFDTTYRFTTPVAELETELFYQKDDLQLSSGVTRPEIPDVTDTPGLPDWARAALDPESRVTLIVHDDEQFTKDSPVEEAIAKTLLDALPVASAGDVGPGEVTAGVVVPFRLQRRRMQASLPPEITVDTVERFQGDEKDVMVLSMTAGNQGYVNSLAEFLLDENRFNVGLSRMKRKAFVIASKSVFRAISSDLNDYERQKAWKKLYQVMNVAERSPDGHMTLTQSDIPDLAAGREVTLEVYTGFAD